MKVLKALRVSILTVLFVTGVEKVMIEYIFVTKTGEDILTNYEVVMSVLLVIRILSSLTVLFIFLACLVYFVRAKK